MPNHFPIMLRLHGENCLIVGGGMIAYRKTLSLLECGAKVQVVSPILVPELMTLVTEGRVSYEEREFRPDDLERVLLVIGATNHRELNREISQLAKERRLLVNIVDQPEDCSFIIPAIHRAGALALAVTTEGKSPALAARIRRELEEFYPCELYGLLLEWLGLVRNFVLSHVEDPARRREILLELADLDLPAVLADNRNELALQRIAALVADLPGSVKLLELLRSQVERVREDGSLKPVLSGKVEVKKQ